MRYKVLSIILLITASVLSVFVAGIVLFAGAYFIEGVSDGNLEPINETIRVFLSLLSLMLFVFSVLLAWFKRRTGSILMTVFAILPLLLEPEFEPEIAWIKISILFVGPALFIIDNFDRKNKRQQMAGK